MTFANNKQVCYLREGQWSVVPSSFPYKLDIFLYTSTAILIFPYGELISPYLLVHSPALSLEKFEKVDEHAEFKSHQRFGRKLSLNEIIELYEKQLQSVAQIKHFGVYMASGSRVNMTDILLSTYFVAQGGKFEVFGVEFNQQRRIEFEPNYGVMRFFDFAGDATGEYTIGCKYPVNLNMDPTLGWKV